MHVQILCTKPLFTSIAWYLKDFIIINEGEIVDRKIHFDDAKILDYN